ncbi:SusC/RagA family TonB-linked outer membrane protein [Pedobacter mucosus]|uniref:SusC/RagA family TonB-linked outer membrane protein n=1 Tax=Pedobacter mucosus TaxID=2895286 RepID=UPI001EE4C3E7|nr:SusC/RagA family TonB-linked outer membrane protein [Pedobacter mucosus]UKT64977.1 SusC/RagA family TonB-linked outer membrane protein [Pedobacter mucosus]
MKLIILLTCLAILNVSAASFGQKISLSENSAQLGKVFEKISAQTGYDFLFPTTLLKGTRPVSINVRNEDLSAVLKKVFEDQPLEYSIEDKSIVVFAKEKSVFQKIKDLVISSAITVNGSVTNKEMEPLSGATVVNKRTNTGTTTDVNGVFSLSQIEQTDTLVVSYIGYAKVFYPIGKGGYQKIVMSQTTNGLDEVVVQAYGKTTIRTATGNIGQVTAKEIAVQPVTDLLLALQGKIPGVVITQQNGFDSGPIKVEIRGRASINSKIASDPLYIVDGVPLTVSEVAPTNSSTSLNAISQGFDQTGMSFSRGQNPLFSINPSDIESVSILKDADATAIYGSRGANGVVLITTKRGKAGQTQFNFSASQGVRSVVRHWEMLNTQEYLEMRREAFRNDNIAPTIDNAPDLLAWDQNAYTDWQDYAYGGTGKWTDAQVSLSGGNPQTTFRLSANFNHTTDITAVSGANMRGGAGVNVNHNSPSQRFKVSFNANYTFSEVNQILLPASIAILPPNAPAAFTSSGNFNFDGWGTARASFPFNPLLRPYTARGKFLTANAVLSYSILKGLVIKTNLGYNNSINDQEKFSPIISFDPIATTPPTGSATFGFTKNNNWVVEPQMEYNGLIGKGNLSVLLGGTLQSTETGALKTEGTGYTSDALLYTITNALTKTVTDIYSEYKYAGIFGRIGYNWLNKYIINLNGRRDGSSRFGANNRFGNFGSLGVAWIMSDEKFIEKFLPKAISLVKLRGSYGLTGSDGVQDYQYLSQYGNSANLLPYGGAVPSVPLIQPNEEFHWQVNKKLEGAIDISLLEDRLNLEAVYYSNRCNNQLLAFPIPAFSGFTSVTGNSPANVRNSGYEFSANGTVIRGKNFSWSSSFNIGFNKNVLLSYPDIARSPYARTYRVGESLDINYMFNYLGVNPLTGQYTFEDYNGDGKSSQNISVLPGTQADDRYIAIFFAPKFSGGLTNQFNYKGISLTANFTFRKQTGINALTNIGGPTNISAYQYDNRWQYPGQVALTARVTTTSNISDLQIASSNAGYTDASFIRLQTLALGYQFPKKLINKLGVQNLGISVNAQNIFVITGYKGLDPEITNFGSLPSVRTITSSLTCSF